MKITVTKPVEIEVEWITIHLPVRYEEEDIPNDFPLRNGDVWSAKVNLETGVIDGWPTGKSGKLEMKVCDEGVYRLHDAKGNIVGEIDQDYVPHGVVPGEYGDYVHLDIDENGQITNWPRKLNFSKFFGGNNETD